MDLHDGDILRWSNLANHQVDLQQFLSDRRPEDGLSILEKLLSEKRMPELIEEGKAGDLLYYHWLLLHKLKSDAESQRAAKKYLRYLRQRKLNLKGEDFLKELATCGEHSIWVDQFRFQFLLATNSYNKIQDILSNYRQKLSDQRFISYLYKLLDNPLLLSDVAKYLIQIERSAHDIWDVVLDLIFLKVEGELKRSDRSENSGKLLHLLFEYIILFPHREKGPLKTILYSRDSDNPRLSRGAAKGLDSGELSKLEGDRRGTREALFKLIKNAISGSDDFGYKSEAVDLGDDLFVDRNSESDGPAVRIRKLVRDLNFLTYGGRKEAAVLVLKQIQEIDSEHPVLVEFSELLNTPPEIEIEAIQDIKSFELEEKRLSKSSEEDDVNQRAMTKVIDLMSIDELLDSYQDIHAALYCQRMWGAIDKLLSRVALEPALEWSEQDRFNIEYLRIQNLFSMGHFYQCLNAAGDALFEFDLEGYQQIALAYYQGESWWMIGNREKAYQIYKMIISKCGNFRLASMRVREFNEY